jgi:hypothetical protein
MQENCSPETVESFFLFPGRLFASTSQNFEPTFNGTPAVVCAITSCKAHSCEVITAVYCYYAKEGGRSWVKKISGGRFPALSGFRWKISDGNLGLGRIILGSGEDSPTSGRASTRNPETFGNARSYPRFFWIRKSDPTGSEFT